MTSLYSNAPQNQRHNHHTDKWPGHKTANFIWSWIAVQNCVDWHSLWPVTVGCATTGCLRMTCYGVKITVIGWAVCFTVRNVWLNLFEALLWGHNWHPLSAIFYIVWGFVKWTMWWPSGCAHMYKLFLKLYLIRFTMVAWQKPKPLEERV